MPSRFLRCAAGVLAAACACSALAAPPTPERVVEICARVESAAHCGRLVEAEQLESLPDLARRDGDTLTVKLFPSGERRLVDAIATPNEQSYALWDYWSPVNAVILFLTSGDEINYAILQRATGQLTVLPAEPVLAPDRQRLAVADFCAQKCANELSVWRVSREGVRKELLYRPPVPWSDVTAAWKDADTLTLHYTPAGAVEARSERKLGAGDWKRP